MKITRLILVVLVLGLFLSGCSFTEVTFGEEKGIDLYGTYDENDLFIDSINLKLSDEELKIPVIKGLKNTTVQDKINKEMNDAATALIGKYPEINYANYYAYANFANVISISFTVGFDEEPYSESIYFNYNLVDGSKLKLEDLFVSDVNLIDIVRSAVYDQKALYGGYDKETFVHYPNEEEVYKIVKGYLNSENKKFAFSPSGIFLYPKNNFAEVKMIDYASVITIYSKFLTKKSIYTGEYKGFKNAFTCSDTNYDYFDKIEYGYIEDNLWYDFTSSEDYFPNAEQHQPKIELFEKFRAKKIDELFAYLEEYRIKAKENPDMFYIVLIKPNISLYKDSVYKDGEWYYSYSDMATVFNQVFVYSMPKSTHDEIYRDKIIETYRYEYFVMRGGAYFEEPTEDEITFEEILTTEVFNYVTGEKLTELDQIFDPESNYIEIIKDAATKSLVANGYSKSTATELCENMTLSLKGDKIEATVSSLPQFSVQVYFSQFKKEHFKLF